MDVQSTFILRGKHFKISAYKGAPKKLVENVYYKMCTIKKNRCMAPKQVYLLIFFSTNFLKNSSMQILPPFVEGT